AGRLMDEFQRPAVAVGRTAEGTWVGSGRSVHGFDITAALDACREYVTKFGGHYFACGFTLINEAALAPLGERLQHLAASALTDAEVAAVLPIDAAIDLARITFPLQQALEQLEPHGPGNPKPRFVSRGLQVQDVRRVGSSGRHLRLMVSQPGGSAVVKLIGFSIVDRIPLLQRGDTIDVVLEVDINHWNGNRELQLKIVDVLKAN
ncbi:MAG: DHHA1 domain-containing protein, partial [Patescibacteria group bacterium]